VSAVRARSERGARAAKGVPGSRGTPRFERRGGALLTFFLSPQAAPNTGRKASELVVARSDTGEDRTELTRGIGTGKFLQVAPLLRPRGWGSVCV
jgi:hypothetical protein